MSPIHLAFQGLLVREYHHTTPATTTIKRNRYLNTLNTFFIFLISYLIYEIMPSIRVSTLQIYILSHIPPIQPTAIVQDA